METLQAVPIIFHCFMFTKDKARFNSINRYFRSLFRQLEHFLSEEWSEKLEFSN
jgi:hypothetical protein